MVVTEKMAQSVNYKIMQFAVVAVAVLFRLLFGAVLAYGYRTDKNIAVFAYVERKILLQNFFAAYSVERRERKNVGYGVFAAVFCVEFLNLFRASSADSGASEEYSPSKAFSTAEKSN